LALIVIVAAGAALAACGGDDGGARPTTVSGDNGGAGSTEDQFREAVRKFPDATYRAEYQVAGPELAEFGDARVTFYKDGSDRLRIDVASEQDGQQYQVILIQDGDESAFCTSGGGPLADVFGGLGDGACFRRDPTGGAAFGGIADEFEGFDSDDLDASDFTSEQIAGEDAYCARVTASDRTSNACFSGDGVMLSVESEGSGLRAVSVSDDVGGGDFELPYDVQDIPGLGQ
jgi:hypothetical protein